jgi:hypothetical protein
MASMKNPKIDTRSTAEKLKELAEDCKKYHIDFEEVKNGVNSELATKPTLEQLEEMASKGLLDEEDDDSGDEVTEVTDEMLQKVADAMFEQHEDFQNGKKISVKGGEFTFRLAPGVKLDENYKVIPTA